MPWPVTSSRVAYENRWIEVTEDQVVLPDGRPGLYGVVTVRRPAVFVVALTEAAEVLLVEVDRHTTGRSWEVPAGGTDGEDPVDAARRELLEETGYTAGTWRQIGSMNALNGICRAPETVWLATDLTAASADSDAAREAEAEQASEGISGVRLVPLDELLAMVEDGTVSDGETVAALMYALLALDRV